MSFLEAVVYVVADQNSAGPYDAAAPSRNVNLPASRAPISAFNGAPVQSPPRTGPSTISLASPPAPPAKDPPGENHVSRRAQSALRQAPPANRRVSGGGLTGQYSTSMPASGGYFPDPDEQIDEAALQRKERQKERESKRKAIKAAWGIDNRKRPSRSIIGMLTMLSGAF